jgi:hypothetical protein
MKERQHRSDCKKKLTVERVQGEKLPIGGQAIAGGYSVS